MWGHLGGLRKARHMKSLGFRGGRVLSRDLFRVKNDTLPTPALVELS